MQTIVSEKTVGELAAAYPPAARIFEKLGIDYCCGGGKTLAEACRKAALPLEQLRDSLDSALSAPPAPGERDWKSAPLADLIAHIRNTHHQFTRAEIARLDPLFQKVVTAHGKNHPELAKMQATFAGLAEELSAHLMKEEMVLFPYIEGMEEAVIEQSPVLPAPFGTVRNPVLMMMQEHDGAGEALREMRAASNGYTAPPDACASYRALYQALAEFEADLHQHIHLENNVLFPRAVEMERESASRS
jgi:regulator of cell morphogenesis and NO signaling